MTTTALVILAILVVGLLVALGLLRNALFRRAAAEILVDSDTPPNVLGRPIDFGICEEPRLFCPDPGRGGDPDPAKGQRALVGVRPDRFVTRHAVYYTADDCADDPSSASDVYVAPPPAPAPLGILIPDLPVGYLDGLETVASMTPLSYAVGAPAGFDFATQSPTGPGRLYRSADEAIATATVRSVWTSLAPDCALEPLPCEGSGSGLGGEQKISSTQGGFTGALDASDRFGTGLGSLGDLDGDGVPDVAVGALEDDDGGTNHGAVWVLFLNADGTVKAHQKISDTAGGFTGVLDTQDQFGWGVEGIGDLDGDGVADLAVGARQDDDGGPNRGAVWILFLNVNGTVKAHQKISSTAGGFAGPLTNGDGFGISIGRLGDLDGDGVEDLAVGASLDVDGGPGRGAVWILFLNSNGTVKASQKISDLAGGFTGVLDNQDRFGAAVAGTGDLDGDGVPDVAVGANRDDDGAADAGAVWILFLNAGGTVKSHQKISATTGGFGGTLDVGDFFGEALESLGDLDGDGVADLGVGAPRDDDGGTDRGAVWLLFLTASGTVQAQEKISSTSGGLTGPLDDSDRFGLDLGALGDLDGDGAIELAAGAILDDDGGADRGAVWILSLGALPPYCLAPPEELCTNIEAIDLSLLRAEEVVSDPAVAGSPNVLAGFVPPFLFSASTAAEIAPAPEDAPAVPPPGTLIPPAPE